MALNKVHTFPDRREQYLTNHFQLNGRLLNWPLVQCHISQPVLELEVLIHEIF